MDNSKLQIPIIDFFNASPGDILNGFKIVEIIGVHKDIIVFINDVDGLSYQHTLDSTDIKPHLDRILAIMGKIKERIPQSDVSLLSYRKTLIRELGYLFYINMTNPEIEYCSTSYDAIEKRINKIIEPDKAELAFYIMLFFSSALMCIVSFFTYKHIQISYSEVFVCIGCGTLGAFLSILFRRRKLKICRHGGLLFLFMQAFFLIITGTISGFFVYILIQSDIVFTFAKTNKWSIYSLSFISGFSEIFVPNLIDKVQDQVP